MISKLKIIDITPKAEGKQVGAVNVNVENRTENQTYNFNFYSAEAAEAFVAGFKITTDFEEKVKEEAERRLIASGISPDILSANTSTEVASAALASNAVLTMKTLTFKSKK